MFSEQGRTKVWEDRFRQQRCWAEELALKYGGDEKAVNLRDITAHLGVQRVAFRPLLVDGALGKSDNGLIIYVKCDKERISDFEAAFSRTGGIDLPNRARFTIAHEIAHMFFIDRDGKSKIPTKHHKQLKSLEVSCDQAANRLLLPNTRFLPLVECESFLDASFLKTAAHQHRVSCEALVLRIREQPLWAGGIVRGLIAVVGNVGAEERISVAAVDNTSTPLFPGAKRGAILQQVLPGIRAEMLPEVPCRLTIPCSRLGSLFSQECEVTCARLSRARYLIAVRVAH